MTRVTEIRTLREASEEVGRLLREQGGLSAIVVELTSGARIERAFGQSAYQSMRSQVEAAMSELKDRVREGDLLARDDREMDRFVVFLAPRRDGASRFNAGDLRKLAERIEEQLGPRLARVTLPYLRDRGIVQIGYGFVLDSPLESQERLILHLVDECLASSELRRRLRDRDQKEGLLEIIHDRKVWTAFQPIVEIESRQVIGHEGLSRGPRGSELEPPVALFGTASRFGLVEALERSCRRQTFVDWEVFGGSGRLFLNTVPATVRDTGFLGRGLLDYLGPRLSPRGVTLEINERQVIANLHLYREAMHAFLDLGFTFAIDDVGAGYSGLETIATLGASYLKIDMGLVRDVHHKKISQQIVKAILDMATGVGATVIAEGIETREEADALKALGVLYGQGYHFGRPQDPYAAVSRAAAGSSA